MTYEFDKQLSLRGNHASKYDKIGEIFGVDDPDIIPMWVADMDFAAAPAITEALRREVERGYYGYFGDTREADAAVAGWYRRRHGWEIDPGAVRYTHGVVSGFADVLDTFSAPGDAVVLFPPVYHAFYRKAKAMGREIRECPLVLEDGVYRMDLDRLRAALTGREKVVTLCSPHNPGGRIWDAGEIRELADFCGEHGLILASDEIHMDLCFPGVPFTPTGVAAPEVEDRLVVLTAASKGFNIAGAETGLLIVPDKGLRAQVDRVLAARESSPNRFGMAMVTAAFTGCDDWSEAVRGYIAENARLFAERMNGLPGVSMMPMQATYLTWVDFSPLGMSDADLMRRCLEAGVAASPGTQFGTGGTGHMRFNVALPRPSLMEAIARLEKAFSDIQ